MQDLPENHFTVSGASWVNIMIYFILFIYIDLIDVNVAFIYLFIFQYSKPLN